MNRSLKADHKGTKNTKFTKKKMQNTKRNVEPAAYPPARKAAGKTIRVAGIQCLVAGQAV